MITLTKAIRGAMDYDDEIHINPDHIKTLRVINLPASNVEDETIVVTEIECGLIISGEDGSVDSEPIYVLEQPFVIYARIQEWVRSIRGG